ncbi:unnamed protein product [Albugo candida]|uniref:Uncharacterized protein n=1 Tax=Albugo candida TaxID=65357 RepID=A0A024G2Y7_9STRA|nr:unnamed protein product [Albugo candida]|eukprot:CCI41021.1 unnamed protein product [Albugo candida]
MAPDRRTAADFVAQVYGAELAGFWEGLVNAGSAILMEDAGKPANSPDLNPIENVWAKTKAAILKPPKAKNSDELRLQLEQAWSAIDPEWLQHLVNSMPERIKAVIETKGGSPRW